MKSISTHGLFLAAIFFALQTGCGHSDSTSTLRDTTSQNCADSAKSKRDSAYVDATKAFEADAAACYLLLDDQQYLPASICLKKAGSARKQTILDADAAFTMAMSQCQSRA
jgi:hypothetical protein